MRIKLAALLFTIFVCAGCGGGGGIVDVFTDPFDDDFATELLAFDDQYSTLQNQVLSVGDSNGVLANDFFCFCDGFELTFPPLTASGGSVRGLEDGSFIYTPPLNFTGTDFFEYRIEDDFGSSAATVTIAVNVAPDVGFFVDNAQGSDTNGSGQTGAPFATIQAALLAAGANGTVVVRPGNGLPYAGAINLMEGQTLVGAGFELLPAQGVIRPEVSGPIRMADLSVVRGLTLNGGRVDGVGVQDGEVSQCDFSNIAEFALDLDGAGGIWVVEDNLMENCAGGVSVVLDANEELVALIQFNTFRNNSQSAIFIDTLGSSDLVAGLFDNRLTDHPSGFAVDARAGGASSLCMDISRNQNDDTYRLTRNGALFQVEELSELTNLNTGTVTVTADPILEVADGFCGF